MCGTKRRTGCLAPSDAGIRLRGLTAARFKPTPDLLRPTGSHETRLALTHAISSRQYQARRCAQTLGYSLRLLGASAASHNLRIHAYVLMGNHVHLLVSSRESGKESPAMRQLGQAYVTAFNRRHRCSGTLWEGCFKLRPGFHTAPA